MRLRLERFGSSCTEGGRIARLEGEKRLVRAMCMRVRALVLAWTWYSGVVEPLQCEVAPGVSGNAYMWVCCPFKPDEARSDLAKWNRGGYRSTVRVA